MTLSDFAALSESELASYIREGNTRTLTPEQVAENDRMHDAEDFTPAERMAAYGV